MASSDINSVVIVGRLTRDVELKYMNNGNAVASMQPCASAEIAGRSTVTHFIPGFA